MKLPQNLTLYLMTPLEQAARAGELGLPLAYMAYRVGGGPHLFRTQHQTPPRGGLMVLDYRGFDGRGTPEGLCREVMQECAARGFRGVFCDFEGQVPALLRKAVENLTGLLRKRNCGLYLPESCASWAPGGATMVISSAISGGSLHQRLAQGVERFGRDRLALGLERVAEDFTLPATNGSGEPLSQEGLEKLIRERSPAVYFSDELCAHYFTYMRPGESPHFILYDDAASLAKKLHVAAALGIGEAFLPYMGNERAVRELLA